MLLFACRVHTVSTLWSRYGLCVCDKLLYLKSCFADVVFNNVIMLDASQFNLLTVDVITNYCQSADSPLFK